MNLRTDDRTTARPSAPRENGVVPEPFSCNSQRLPSTTTSATEHARPSPYPFPVLNGQLSYISDPKMDNAYGVAHDVSIPGTAPWSAPKKRTYASDLQASSERP